MGGLRERVLCHFVSSTCFQMNRRKTLNDNVMDTPLRRCLSTVDITLLGIETARENIPLDSRGISSQVPRKISIKPR